MSEQGVIPRHKDRQPRAVFRQTSEMSARGGAQVAFGYEGTAVVIVTTEDIVLGRDDQDEFARHYFRAVTAAEPLEVTEAPF